MRSIKYIINHKLLEISLELQSRSSKILSIAQSGFTTLQPNRKIVKVEKIIKGSLYLIPSPSPSVKIQIVGGKAY